MPSGTLMALLVKLGVDATDLEKGLDAGRKSAVKGGKGISSGMKSALVTIAGVTAAAAGFGIVAKKAFDLARQGEEINRAEDALIGYAGGADAAERATLAVSEAAGGLLTQFESTQAASKFMAMGLATSADEAAELTEMAVTLGASMNMKAGPAIENFALMLANNSIPRMDSYGMSADKTRARMEELAALYPAMTRNERFLATVREQGAAKLDMLKESGFEAATSADKMATAWGDFQDTLKKLLAGPMGVIVDKVTELIKVGQKLIDSTVDEYDAYADLDQQYQDGIITLEEYSDAYMNLLKPATDAGTQSVLHAIEARAQELRGLRENTNELELNAMIRGKHAEEIDAQSAATNALGLQIAREESAIRQAHEAAQEFDSTFDDLKRSSMSAIDSMIGDWGRYLMAVNTDMALIESTMEEIMNDVMLTEQQKTDMLIGAWYEAQAQAAEFEGVPFDLTAFAQGIAPLVGGLENALAIAREIQELENQPFLLYMESIWTGAGAPGTPGALPPTPTAPALPTIPEGGFPTFAAGTAAGFAFEGGQWVAGGAGMPETLEQTVILEDVDISIEGADYSSTELEDIILNVLEDLAT